MLKRIIQGLLAGDPITWWLAAFAVAGLLVGVYSGYFRARKIQPNGFKWRIFRNEVVFAAINVAISGLLLGAPTKYLQHHGFIQFNAEPASPWTLAFEYALYFIGFDTWFYWLHRAMHVEPIYRLVHKLHHRSISPNPLTTLSVSPLESLVNGGWTPLFTLVMTGISPVHRSTMALIAPTYIVMGLYVHSGIEFLPRWWNSSWLTKWFISATFHDQHHRFFKGNYGGFTTVWDRFCGTVRPSFEADFLKVTTRPIRRGVARAGSILPRTVAAPRSDGTPGQVTAIQEHS